MQVDGLAVEFHQNGYATSRERAALAGVHTAEQARSPLGERIRKTHLFNMAHHYANLRAALDVFDNDYDMGFSETLQNLMDGNASERGDALVRMCELCDLCGSWWTD
jgi:hypothetical protein